MLLLLIFFLIFVKYSHEFSNVQLVRSFCDVQISYKKSNIGVFHHPSIALYEKKKFIDYLNEKGILNRDEQIYKYRHLYDFYYGEKIAKNIKQEIVRLRRSHNREERALGAYAQMRPREIGDAMFNRTPSHIEERQRAIGYRWNEFGVDYIWSDVLDALQIYKKLYGHINVPEDYLVARYTDDEIQEIMRHIPKEKQLGYTGEDSEDDDFNLEKQDPNLTARIKAMNAEIDATESIGIEESVGEEENNPLYPSPPPLPKPLPREMKKLLKKEKDYFPIEYHLMPLGHFVKGIKIGDIDGAEILERREALDNLGFVWGDFSTHLRFRYLPFVMLYDYFRQRYDLFDLAHDLKIPQGEGVDYDIWMRNAPLGEWFSIAKIQRRMLAIHYPERYEMLNKLEIPWEQPPPRALQLKFFGIPPTVEELKKLKKLEKFENTKKAEKEKERKAYMKEHGLVDPADFVVG